MLFRLLLIALLAVSVTAWAQVPATEAEITAERALREGLAAAKAGRWEAAIGHFSSARSQMPQALEPLYNLGLAHDRAGHPLEAASWYKAYLAVSFEPEEAEQDRLCKRMGVLVIEHERRVQATLVSAGAVIAAAREAVLAAPPPEGGSRDAELGRLASADADLAEARRLLAAPGPDSSSPSIREGFGVSEAWLAFAADGPWQQFRTVSAVLRDARRQPVERALAAGDLARRMASSLNRFKVLAAQADAWGRGCPAGIN